MLGEYLVMSYLSEAGMQLIFTEMSTWKIKKEEDILNVFF